MIKKGEVNLYNRNTKAIQARRDLVKGFHKIAGDRIIYLAIDMDLGKDFVFGEDNFPSVVAVYQDIPIRTGDGKPLNLTREVNPFGFQLANSKEIYLNMDMFHEETNKVNDTIDNMKGSGWIPLNGDIIIDPIYNEIYKVNSVNDAEAEQFSKDKNTWKIVLVPHTIKNMNTANVEFLEDELPNAENIMNALNGLYGTTVFDNETGEPELKDKVINKNDVKEDIYELDSDGNVVVTRSREEILGEF